MSTIAFQNRHLIEKRKKLLDFKEFQPFLRSFFFWLCYYNCSTADVEKHHNAFPLLVKEINHLSGKTLLQRIARLNDLLRSLEGRSQKRGAKAGGEEHKDKESGDKKRDNQTLYFSPVYDTDRNLEK